MKFATATRGCDVVAYSTIERQAREGVSRTSARAQCARQQFQTRSRHGGYFTYFCNELQHRICQKTWSKIGYARDQKPWQPPGSASRTRPTTGARRCEVRPPRGQILTPRPDSSQRCRMARPMEHHLEVSRCRGVAALRPDCNTEHVARLATSLHLGMPKTSNLNDAEQFIGDFGAVLLLALPGFANPDRLAYLTKFARRRSALAIRNADPPGVNKL